MAQNVLIPERIEVRTFDTTEVSHVLIDGSKGKWLCDRNLSR